MSKGKAGQYCAVDKHCEVGLHCHTAQKKCVTADAGSWCSKVGHCQDRMSCTKHKCTIPPTCLFDPDCPDAYFCLLKKCVGKVSCQTGKAPGHGKYKAGVVYGLDSVNCPSPGYTRVRGDIVGNGKAGVKYIIAKLTPALIKAHAHNTEQDLSR